MNKSTFESTTFSLGGTPVKLKGLIIKKDNSYEILEIYGISLKFEDGSSSLWLSDTLTAVDGIKYRLKEIKRKRKTVVYEEI